MPRSIRESLESQPLSGLVLAPPTRGFLFGRAARTLSPFRPRLDGWTPPLSGECRLKRLVAGVSGYICDQCVTLRFWSNTADSRRRSQAAGLRQVDPCATPLIST